MKSLERKILANQFRDQIEVILSENGFGTRSVFDYNDLCGLMAAAIVNERDRCIEKINNIAPNPGWLAGSENIKFLVSLMVSDITEQKG